MFEDCASPRSDIGGGWRNSRRSLQGERERAERGDSPDAPWGSTSAPWGSTRPAVFGDSWQKPRSQVDGLRSLVRRVTGAPPPPELTLEDISQRTDELGDQMNDLNAKVDDLDQRAEQIDIQTRDLTQRAAFMEIPDVQQLSRRVEVLEETLAWMNIKTLLSRWSQIERKTESVTLESKEWQRQYEIKMKPYFAGVTAYHEEKRKWEERFMKLEQRMGDLESDASTLLMVGGVIQAESAGELSSDKSPSREAWLRLAKDVGRLTQETEKTKGWFECAQRQVELVQTETDKSTVRIESLESTVTELKNKLQAVDTAREDIEVRLGDIVARSLSWSEARHSREGRSNSQALSGSDSARNTARTSTPDVSTVQRPSGNRPSDSFVPDNQARRTSVSRQTERGVSENQGRRPSSNRHTEDGAEDRRRKSSRTESSVPNKQSQRRSAGMDARPEDGVTPKLAQGLNQRSENSLPNTQAPRPSRGTSAPAEDGIADDLNQGRPSLNSNADDGGVIDTEQGLRPWESIISYIPLRGRSQRMSDGSLAENYTL